MKSIRLQAARIAATAVAMAFAVPVLAASITGPIIVQPNIPGTPDDGLICRGGYTPSFSGTVFKCSKTQVITVALECPDTKFKNYVNRAISGNSDGQDLCTIDGVTVTSNGPLTGLKEGKDYAYAVAKTDTIQTRTLNKDHDEAVALGLQDSDVDTVASQPQTKVNGGSGVKDNAEVTLTFYTLGVRNLGLVSTTSPFPLAR